MKVVNCKDAEISVVKVSKAHV